MRRVRMITIRDIARESGYSISTVSRVLNNKKHVSKKAKEDITRVIEALDYVPNTMAQDLSNGRTKSIGVVLPHIDHPYFTHLLDGILRAAFTTDYRILILPSEYNEEKERLYLEQLRRKALDGLIFTSRRINMAEVSYYQRFGPVVCCEQVEDRDILSTYSLRKPGYIEAFQWIKSQGKTQGLLVFSRGADVSQTARETMVFYEEVFGKNSLEPIVMTDVTTYDEAYQRGQVLCREGREIDFVFANSDDTAVGIRQAYLDQGKKLPLFVGQENQISGQLLALPTIDHCLRRVGEEAFLMAIKESPHYTKPFPAKFLLHR